MASTKEFEAQLRKVAAQIGYLRELVDERLRLTTVLSLSPSKADNVDLIDSLSTTKKALDYLFEDIGQAHLKDSNTKLGELVNQYNAVILLMELDSHISIEEYRFTRTCDPEPKKSVRFKDNQEEVDRTENLRNELMGTAKSFKPYSDSEEGAAYESDRNTLLSIDTSNQEMFASHQQQMLEQDQDLDRLSSSIQNQYRMGLNINSEVDEHMIILNDLERGVDGSGVRLRRATNGIDSFRRKVSDNGSLATIVVLTVILILLLVVLN